eukprot:3467980-Heterocapsa_arctica.AAC.1
MKAVAVFRPSVGMSHMEALMLSGIHSARYEELLLCMLSICLSASFTLEAGAGHEAVVADALEEG